MEAALFKQYQIMEMFNQRAAIRAPWIVIGNTCSSQLEEQNVQKAEKRRRNQMMF